MPDHLACFSRGSLRRRIHETTVCRHDHVDRVRPICEQDDGTKQPTPLEGAEKSDEPEDAANDDEACLHDIAPLVGRLPLGEERAIVKLKARWLLGDVDVNRSPVNAAATVSARCPTSICLLPSLPLRSRQSGSCQEGARPQYVDPNAVLLG